MKIYKSVILIELSLNTFKKADCTTSSQTNKKEERSKKIASFCESSSSLTTADRKKSQQEKKEQENSSQGCRNSEESQLNRKVTLQFLYKKNHLRFLNS